MSKLPDEIAQQFAAYNHTQMTVIEDAFVINDHAKDCEASSDTTGHATETTDSTKDIRVVAVGQVIRLGHFKVGGREQVEKAIDMLDVLGAVANRTKESTGGRPKENVFLEVMEHNDLATRILAVVTPGEVIKPPAYIATYYDVPEDLVKALAERKHVVKHREIGAAVFGKPERVDVGPLYSEEESSDIIDAFHLWRFALDNFVPIDKGQERLKRASEAASEATTLAPTANGRQVLVASVREQCSRFRNSPQVRVDVAIQTLEKRGGICIGPLPGDRVAAVTFYEEVLPSKLWEETSPTHKCYHLRFEDAQRRLVAKLLGKSLDALPTEPPKAIPEAVVILMDTFVSISGENYWVRKDDVITDGAMIRKLIDRGVPMAGKDEPIKNRYFCPKCTLEARLTEPDPNETRTFMRPLRELQFFKDGSNQRFGPDYVIEDPAMIAWFEKEFPDAPVECIQRHEFIRCKGCHKVWIPMVAPSTVGRHGKPSRNAAASDSAQQA